MTEQKTKTDTITIKKDTLWKYSTFILAGIVILGLVAFVLPDKGITGNVVDEGLGALPTVSAKVVEGDHFVMGNINSRVKIIEYSDFECPFCQRAYEDAVTQIKNSYTDAEVAVVYRQFPLTSIHPNAQKAAEASECAAEQNNFVGMHDLLFERGVAGGTSAFKLYAAEIGLDVSQFNNCLDSGKYAGEVAKDLSQGQKEGIRGTPGFIVDGTLVNGAQPFPVFKQLIDASLA